jgi:16S rRNA (cytosine1402-N4)-methyltransferase
MATDPVHLPVLRDRVVELLAPAAGPSGSVVVDCTVGLGGHAEAILRAVPGARLVGLDRDDEALERSAARLAPFAPRVSLVHAVYDELPRVLADLGLVRVQGVLFDLGVSSLQLDDPRRGFSYSRDAPLDMRMDQGSGQRAEDVVNGATVEQLTRILRDYGQERFATRVARAIVRERERAPLTSSARLAELVRDAIPAAARRQGGHPAKRAFQALRIEVNGELAALERALPAAVDALAVGGRIVALSYHSLEDRLVKHALVSRSRVTSPPDLPVIPDSDLPELRLLTRGAEHADAAEAEGNPRSAGVRLRAAERIREAA